MAAPVITSLVPTHGKYPNTVSINGTGLDQGFPTVKFGTTVATNVIQYSSTVIVVTVPIMVTNTYGVTVTNSGGVSNSQNFLVDPIPVVITGYPSQMIPSEQANIGGSGFAQLSAPVLKISTNPETTITPDSYTDTLITFHLPVVPPNNGYILIIDNGTGGHGNTNAMIVPQYDVITVAVNCDPALSITNVEYSTDAGAHWNPLPTGVYYYEHFAFTARFRATMNNPNGYQNIYFAIRIQPAGTVLASIYTSRAVQSLTTADHQFGSNVTLEFYAALP